MTRLSKVKAVSGMFRSFLHKFDKFAEPVAKINMNGQTEAKSKVGGMCGLAVFIVMIWFVVIEFEEMITRAEPTIYQVTSAINLMADDTPAFNLAENNFTVGYGAHGWNGSLTENDDGNFVIESVYEAIDISSLISISTWQTKITKDGTEYIEGDIF
jgi:hypothetical protein